MVKPSQRREMAQETVRLGRASIRLACCIFVVSETCYRYGPKLRAENEEIADLLVGLTDARKTWGFGLCFLFQLYFFLDRVPKAYRNKDKLGLGLAKIPQNPQFFLFFSFLLDLDKNRSPDR